MRKKKLNLRTKKQKRTVIEKKAYIHANKKRTSNKKKA